MPKISSKKEEKIKEQILHYLYSIFPKQPFTAKIAEEIARDEEFTKKLLLDLNKEELALKIVKNPEGVTYSRRIRWRLSNKAHQAYSRNQ